MFLREKSPLYPLEGNEAVARACSTLSVDPADSRAKLLSIWKVYRITIFAFDLWNEAYNWATAHYKTDLPVILIDYGKRLSYVRVGSQGLRDEVNGFVANQHRLHGWDVRPPYFQDQTGPVPTYLNPRDQGLVQPDGTVRRMQLTPPPDEGAEGINGPKPRDEVGSNASCELADPADQPTLSGGAHKLSNPSRCDAPSCQEIG